MRLRWLINASMALLVAPPAGADPRPLGSDEIRTLLTGNTVHGTWAGREYFSYFEAGGWTTYVAVGGSRTDGRWSVHDGKYCSVWAGANESCYELQMDGSTLEWVTSAGQHYPSQVLPGNQLPK